jgi:glucosylceramidase
MKNNNDRCHGGKLLKQYYGLWADILLTAIKKLGKEGVKISAITTQNEPLATQTWESCLYTSEEEADFLMNYLIPKAKEYRLDDLKFMIYDHNRDKMLERADEMFAFGLKQEDVFGIAYHWYDRDCYEEVKKTHLKYPNQHILLTECCVELLCDDNNGLGSWENGLRYGISIINDLNNGSEGYIDWNLSLNMQGGPNHVGNFCEAPLLIDAKKDEIKYMPSYYVIGHFSKYLNQSDVKVETKSLNSNLLACSFLDRNILKIILLNTSACDVDTYIRINNENSIKIVSQAKTVYTILISL